MTVSPARRRELARVALMMSLTAALAACGGGSSPPPPAPVPPPPPAAAVATLASPASGEFAWRLAQPAFHHHRVRGYADVMVRHAEETARSFDGGGVRDVHTDMMRLTLVIVAECLFGAQLGPVADDIGELLDVFTARFSGASGSR